MPGEVPPEWDLLPLTVAGERTSVVAVALWFSMLLSGVLEATVAVLLIEDPAATDGAT
jgi:hypothetical protein